MYNVDHTKQSPTCVSFCYGIGGLDNGLERAIGDLRILVVVEIEAVAIANVVAKVESGAMAPVLVYTNAKSFPAIIFRDRVDWFLGGYPCQPFSHAGQRKGTDDPRHLFPHFERAIIAMRPLCCFFENVAGHLTLGFPEVYRSLRKMGYVVEAGIFSAEETGAPHQRERLFILAVHHSYIERFKQEYEVRSRRSRLESSSQMANSSLQSKRKQNNFCNPISTGRQAWQILSKRSSELEYSNSERQRKERECEIRTDFASEQLDDSNGSESSAHRREFKEDRRIEKEKRGSKYSTTLPGRTSSSRTGQMGDSDISGSQGWESRICKECTCEWIARSNGPFDRLLRWPAGPAREQYEWESPRTVITDEAARLLGGYCEKYPESFLQWQVDQVAKDGFASQVKPSLGVTVNGYDFREDFLRALGNAVCPPQAKRAIEVLLQKFKKS